MTYILIKYWWHKIVKCRLIYKIVIQLTTLLYHWERITCLNELKFISLFDLKYKFFFFKRELLFIRKTLGPSLIRFCTERTIKQIVFLLYHYNVLRNIILRYIPFHSFYSFYLLHVSMLIIF